MAEELFFGDTSSGVAGDLQAATELAAQMVGSFGMAGSLISLDAAAGGMGVNVVSKVLSDDTSRATLEGILDSARDHVRAQLSDHQYLVEALRDALLEREELIGVEITDVLVDAQAEHDSSIVDLRDSVISAEAPSSSPAPAPAPDMPANGAPQFRSDPSGRE